MPVANVNEEKERSIMCQGSASAERGGRWTFFGFAFDHAHLAPGVRLNPLALTRGPLCERLESACKQPIHDERSAVAHDQRARQLRLRRGRHRRRVATAAASTAPADREAAAAEQRLDGLAYVDSIVCGKVATLGLFGRMVAFEF
eukprot:scaffold12204_cov61-Phaeocystis_antarctica.AAC.18